MPNFKGQMTAVLKSGGAKSSASRGSHCVDNGPEKRSTTPPKPVLQVGPLDRMHMSMMSSKARPSSRAPPTTAVSRSESEDGVSPADPSTSINCTDSAPCTAMAISHWRSSPQSQIWRSDQGMISSWSLWMSPSSRIKLCARWPFSRELSMKERPTFMARDTTRPMSCTCGSRVSSIACKRYPFIVKFTVSSLSSSPTEGACLCSALLMFLKLWPTRSLTACSSAGPSRGMPRPIRLFATVLCTSSSKKSPRSGQMPGLSHPACSGLPVSVAVNLKASTPSMPNFNGQIKARVKSADRPTMSSGSHGVASGPRKKLTAPRKLVSQEGPLDRMHMIIKSNSVLPCAMAPPETATRLSSTFVAVNGWRLEALPLMASIQLMASTSNVISHWLEEPQAQMLRVAQPTSSIWNRWISASWCHKFLTMACSRSSGSVNFVELARMAMETCLPKPCTCWLVTSCMASMMYLFTVALIFSKVSSWKTAGAFLSMELLIFLKLPATRPRTNARSASSSGGEPACTKLSATSWWTSGSAKSADNGQAPPDPQAGRPESIPTTRWRPGHAVSLVGPLTEASAARKPSRGAT
mmetsp:Transcript_138095/g.385267  ORF Transcript_138095/g.385267 Transcript_138095/m.385267 type:complete len:581 (+) Transcript_138095:2057-3799(+)